MKSEWPKMMIISIECWQCHKPMEMALVGDESGNLEYGPGRFSEKEKSLAEQHGVFLKIIESKTAGESYLGNVCKECGAFIGEFFFFAHYYTPALYGDYKYEWVA